MGSDNALIVIVGIISVVAGLIVTFQTLIRRHYDEKAAKTINEAPAVVEIKEDVEKIRADLLHFATNERVNAMQIKLAGIEKEHQSTALVINDLKHELKRLNEANDRGEKNIQELKTEVNTKLDKIIDLTLKRNR